MSPDLAQKMIIAGGALGAVGLWQAMSQRITLVRHAATSAAALGILTVVCALDGPGGDLADKVLFWLFTVGAVGGGVLMICSHDPVQGALWFAVATLCVCGLFLELSAPFLAAATVIVYAGAIIVTFMFVIMLAQQGGATAYDQRPRLPLPASLVSFFVLGVLVFNLLDWQEGRAATAEGPTLVAAAADGQAATSPPVTDEEAASLQTLGRTLFGHYLFAVELGGTLLLVATIGAIALAPRRQRGHL